MNAPRCSHCGQTFELRRPGDTWCPRCDAAIRQQIADDEQRRTRFAHARVAYPAAR